MGATAEEQKLYERNARNLITLWGDQNSTLNEYSCRQWSGLISSFYKPRWQQFFHYVNQQLKTGTTIDQKAFEKTIKTWEWEWVNKTDAFTEKANGDEINVSRKLYEKYKGQLIKTYNL